MKRRLVLFGLGDCAQLADFYFTHDSDYEVVALTADKSHVTASHAFGRPVVAFEDVAAAYPPSEHDFFVAVGYTQLNKLRRQKYEAAKGMGYRIASYMSSRATAWPGFSLGENCFILEDNTIQPFARVGHNVTLWSGNHIGHHSRIADHTFLASHVVVSGGVEVGEYCFIGVNATLRDRIKVGDRCVIGAGSILAADAEPDGVYSALASQRSPVPSSRLRKL